MALSRSQIIQASLTLVAWLCFFMLPILLIPYNKDFSPFRSQRFVYWFVYTNIILVVFYYINSLKLIPLFLEKKKSKQYVLIIILCLAVYLSIYYLIGIKAETGEIKNFLERRIERDGAFRAYYIFFNGPTFMFLIAFIVSGFSKIVTKWFLAEEVKEEVTKQQLQTELHLLKSQINPHFLFNTLNSIYSLSFSDGVKTGDAVLKLSKIMRYTLDEANNNTVLLSQEIEFINNYIELQKTRLTDKTVIHFEIDNNEAASLTRMPPLLFIAFVENAFKYGVSTQHSSVIDIRIGVQDKKVYFNCVNDILPGPRSLEKSTGTGINNVERRLQLLFGTKYEFSTNSANGKFSVHLVIPAMN
ncbi:MAG: sensor histidine kinase [Chitinophagaceae bacterium]|jgi:sensor histidine kinase YesM|nr:sensor histidine kinase [Chitinophagaceae bacterium]